MAPRTARLALIAAVALLAACGRDEPDHGGWYALRWIERPNAHGPSTRADPQDVCAFAPCGHFDTGDGDLACRAALDGLREGDVIAYRLPPSEARREIATGHLNAIGYRLLKYGHLAIVVRDPDRPDRLRLFSSESFKGANTEEDVATLAKHDWDAYRLDRWDRVDVGRIHEFVRLAKKKAGNWFGYDFTGMLGIWNSDLTPTKPAEIADEYICSTVVVACLWYAGVHLDAVRSRAADLCSPNQVVCSKGALCAPPDAELVAVKIEAK